LSLRRVALIRARRRCGPVRRVGWVRRGRRSAGGPSAAPAVTGPQAAARPGSATLGRAAARRAAALIYIRTIRQRHACVRFFLGESNELQLYCLSCRYS
jgi:hypothetical protein